MEKLNNNLLTHGKRLVLYYQGYCRKCQIISKWVVNFSLGTITRIPLEQKESIQLFFEEYPKAKGYPILFIFNRPVYNYWVFLGVPFAIIIGWVNALKKPFTKL